MSKRKDGQARGKYTLEFKLEAVRLVKGGQAVPVTAKILGVPVQTLGNWVRLSGKGQLKGAGDKLGERRANGAGAPAGRVGAGEDGARHFKKNRLRGTPRPLCIETSSAYTTIAPGQRPLAFWRHPSPSKNLAQGKLRTQLWWHFA